MSAAARVEHAATFLGILAGLAAACGLVFVWRAPDRALTLGRRVRKPQQRGGGDGGEGT